MASELKREVWGLVMAEYLTFDNLDEATALSNIV